MHVSEFISNSLYSCHAHAATKDLPCPHFAALQRGFSPTIPDAADLPSWPWLGFMIRADNQASKAGSQHCILQDPRCFQRLKWGTANCAPRLEHMVYPTAGVLGNDVHTRNLSSAGTRDSLLFRQASTTCSNTGGTTPTPSTRQPKRLPSRPPRPPLLPFPLPPPRAAAPPPCRHILQRNSSPRRLRRRSPCRGT